jgi:hypothetical protein
MALRQPLYMPEDEDEKDVRKIKSMI